MNVIDKEKLVAKILSALTDEEKQQLYVWAKQAHAIRANNSLSVKERFVQLQKLETKPFILGVLKRLFLQLKETLWDKRGWPFRLGAGGLLGGAIVFGGKSVGVAGWGSAIAVKVSLLTSAGGTILGLVIANLEKDRPISQMEKERDRKAGD